MNENTEIDISEYYQTSLSRLTLPDNYAKLIKRIIGHNSSSNSWVGEKFIVKTVGDIVKLDPCQFSKYQGVGKLYVEMLIAFKRELPSLLSSLKQEEKVIELQPKITLSTEQLEMPLNTLALPTQYQKLIKKISRVVNNVVTVQDIFNINLVDFAKLPTVGILYVNGLIEFKNKLPEILEAQSNKSALFKDNYSIEFNEIDNILIEDIENYLWTLNEIKMDVALSRWGFNQKHETLEKGSRYFCERLFWASQPKQSAKT